MSNENVLLAKNHSGLIPSTIYNQLIEKAKQESAILKLCKRVKMDEPKITYPVVADVVGKGCYVGEGQTIPIVTPKTVDVTLEAHRISFIIPCTKTFGDLTVMDLLTSYQNVISDMFVKIIDESILLGATELGSSGNVFNPIMTAAKKQTIVKGTNGSGAVNVLDDVSDCISRLTNNNFKVNGILANLDFENTLRKMKDKNDNFLFSDTSTLFGKGMTYTNVFAEDTATCIVGDWSRCLVGIFKSMQYDYFDSGIIDLGNGESLNLISQYAAALRITCYVASNITYADAFACVGPEVSSS